MVAVAKCRTSPSATYRPRRPEKSTLYRIVARELEPFLAQQDAIDQPVAAFVIEELRSFLECGILAHGFCRLRCSDCRSDHLLPFSCKGRGICPSCSGRRMAETAAHLVDNVIPRVPVRQWVLSLPLPIRFIVGYDSKLLTEVLGVFMRTIRAWYRQAARKQHGLRETQTGAITAIQRFGGALNLNPHFHSNWADGVWDVSGPTPRFVAIDAPTPEQMQALVDRVSKRIRKLLTKRGRLDEDGHVIDVPLTHDDPALALASQASIRNRDERGWKLESVGRREQPLAQAPSKGIAAQRDGFSLHASVAVPKNDRKRLEHLLRYTLRPAIVDDRLTQRDDGKIELQLKTRWNDGTTHLVFTPRQFMQRLVALVPAPQANLTRYHGVFAPNSKWRKKIVPYRRAEQLELFDPDTGKPQTKQDPPPPPTKRPRPDNYDWATLLRRVFEVDVTACRDCGGNVELIAVITSPTAIKRILDHLDLPSTPPQISPRGPPTDQLELLWDNDDHVA